MADDNVILFPENKMKKQPISVDPKAQKKMRDYQTAKFVETSTDKLGLDTYTNTKGFFSEYSKSTASEDMAEVFSHLMIGVSLNNIDPILKKKIQFIKKNLLKIDQNFQL